MHTSNPNTNFYHDLTAFLLAAKRRVLEVSSARGLSAMQALTLTSLHPDEPRPMKDLASLFTCDASNITGIIDGLEQKNLVRRLSHPDDRRIKMIVLTDAGAQLQASVFEELADGQSELLVGLSETECNQLAQIIHKIVTQQN